MLSISKNNKVKIQEQPRIVPLKQKQSFNYRRHGRMVLAANGGLNVVAFEEIVYVKSAGNYCQFYLLDGRRIMVSKTLKHFEQLLDETFKRVHQSNIVNLLHVKCFDFKTATLTMINAAEIAVSRSHKNDIIKLIS